MFIIPEYSWDFMSNIIWYRVIWSLTNNLGTHFSNFNSVIKFIDWITIKEDETLRLLLSEIDKHSKYWIISNNVIKKIMFFSQYSIEWYLDGIEWYFEKFTGTPPLYNDFWFSMFKIISLVTENKFCLWWKVIFNYFEHDFYNSILENTCYEEKEFIKQKVKYNIIHKETRTLIKLLKLSLMLDEKVFINVNCDEYWTIIGSWIDWIYETKWRHVNSIGWLISPCLDITKMAKYYFFESWLVSQEEWALMLEYRNKFQITFNDDIFHLRKEIIVSFAWINFYKNSVKIWEKYYVDFTNNNFEDQWFYESSFYTIVEFLFSILMAGSIKEWDVIKWELIKGSLHQFYYPISPDINLYREYIQKFRKMYPKKMNRKKTKYTDKDISMLKKLITKSWFNFVSDWDRLFVKLLNF